jgi:hypothetical protein
LLTLTLGAALAVSVIMRLVLAFSMKRETPTPIQPSLSTKANFGRRRPAKMFLPSPGQLNVFMLLASRPSRRFMFAPAICTSGNFRYGTSQLTRRVFVAASTPASAWRTTPIAVSPSITANGRCRFGNTTSHRSGFPFRIL